MISIWAYSIASVLVISLISLIGAVTLYLRKDSLNSMLFCLVSFAVGGLLGDAFIHLIPEAFEELGNISTVSMLVMSGVLLFFVLEKFILWRHCHHPTTEDHPHPVVFMNLIGDAVHNLFDGLAVAASYLVSVPVGLATTMAVIFHEIPQEIGDFGILVHGGVKPIKALLFNLLSALFAVAGAVIALTFGPHISAFIPAVLPVTAGGFIYMAGSDLIPSLHGQRDFPKAWLQLLFILLGIGVMYLLLFIGEHG